MSLQGTLEQSPLRDRHFRVLAVGNIINNLGETAFVGIGPLIIVQLTGRDAVPAFVVSVALASLLSPVIGSLVDRWDWRALFLGGLLGQTATITALFVAVRHGTLGALPLAALFFVNSVSANTYLTAWKVGLGYLFPSFRRRARATLNTMYYATGVAGPLIAAVLVRVGDLTWFLIFDLVTFAAPVVSLAVIVRAGQGRPPRQRPAPEASAPGLLSDVAATFHLVSGDRVLRSLLVYFVFVAATPVSLLSSLIALRLEAHYSPLLMIALANLAIYCGNQTVSARSDFAPGTVLATGGLAAVAGVALLPVGFAPVFAVGVALVGMAIGVGLSYYVIALVEFAPESRYGAISGTFGLCAAGTGIVAGGLFAVGLRVSLTVTYGQLIVAAIGVCWAAKRHLAAVATATASDSRG